MTPRARVEATPMIGQEIAAPESLAVSVPAQIRASSRRPADYGYPRLRVSQQLCCRRRRQRCHALKWLDQDPRTRDADVTTIASALPLRSSFDEKAEWHGRAAADQDDRRARCAVRAGAGSMAIRNRSPAGSGDAG